MTVRTAMRVFLFSIFSVSTGFVPLPAQTAAAPIAGHDADLEMAVMLSRHGVRSPLATSAIYDKFAAAPWPVWNVPPGYLTPHGYDLLKIFGAWDRSKFSGEGLLAATGCADAAHITIIADTDQRTRETGKALAEGMFPGCSVPVQGQPDGTSDPLFRPILAGVGHADSGLAAAAILGRIGGDPANLTEAYRPQLTALDRILAGCGRVPANPKRSSILDIPASLNPGSGDPPMAARGPLVSSATIAENLLLEYTEGMSDADTGWGCLDGATLRYVMQLDSAQWDFGFRTPAVAHIYASNLLDHIGKTLEQGVTGKPVPGALGHPGDRLIVLVGHDTNIATVAGALHIDWVLDGRVDDTPPGGALVFELWRSRTDKKPFVRVEYIAQTLEQMRKAEMLTSANPPGVATVFVPGCGRDDLSCTWEGFSEALHQAIDPAYVRAQP
jgi:4-phytase / acid phosphatase